MIPGWLPEVAVTYLAHTAAGMPIRAIARARGCHASTVLRQVRRVEAWRDDPLVDEALERIARVHAADCAESAVSKEVPPCRARPRSLPTAADPRIEREARRILRRLCEKGAFLAVAPTWRRRWCCARWCRASRTASPSSTATSRTPSRCRNGSPASKAGKIACYAITAVGRAALKRLLTEERIGRGAADGLRRGAVAVPGAAPLLRRADGDGRRRLGRAAAALQPRREPAVGARAASATRTARAYLTAELIEAGERLREDFELAQMGPRVTQNWERFLTAGGERGVGRGGRGPAEGPQDARVRVAKAMEALGPGLSDIVFRVCCFLEGLETAEKRLGWSARSGKVVLKIALERLAQHYGIAPGAEARQAG